MRLLADATLTQSFRFRLSAELFTDCTGEGDPEAGPVVSSQHSRVAGELPWQGRYNVISERARHGHVELE